jgi:hypothetical protein
MATHLLVQRAMDEGNVAGLLQQVNDRLSVASWLPLPQALDDGTYMWDSACEAADVVIMDTLDEMLLPAAWPTADELVRSVRCLREAGRRHGVAVVLTARTAEEEVGGVVADDWPAHVARPAFHDVGDVQIRLSAGPPGFLRLATYVRGLGHHDLMIETSIRRRLRQRAQSPC